MILVIDMGDSSLVYNNKRDTNSIFGNLLTL